jgi:EpsI family protein
MASRIALILGFAALIGGAILSNTLLFRQTVQGNTTLTRNIPSQLGPWKLVDEAPASESEVRGLETSDIIKRTYSDGTDYVDLVVAYIAHSSRKSAHAQEACLRGTGAMVGRIESINLKRTPVLAKSLSLDLHNRQQHVYYWYKIGRTYTADYLSSSLKMFLGGLIGSKNQGASLVRLMTPVRRGEAIERIDTRLEDFTVHLIPALETNLP